MYVGAYIFHQIEVKDFVPSSQREGKEKGMLTRAASVGHRRPGLLVRSVQPSLPLPDLSHSLTCLSLESTT